jgi:putative addiction module component (TIGR02574 family)
MSKSSVSEISVGALELPLTDRAALIDRLFDSIDSEVDRIGIQKKWIAESEARIEAFDRGELKAVDGPAALVELRRSIGR